MAQTTKSAAPDTGAPRARRPRGATIASVCFVVGAIVLVTGLAWWRQQVLFTTAFYPAGDDAANTLLVIRAENLAQLSGNYSRVGFHHPGAGLIYLLASGEVLFFTFLGMVPTPFNGQLLASSVYAAAMLALVALAYRRLTRSWSVAALVLGIAFWFFATIAQFGALWFPVLYLPAFLGFVVAAGAVGSGRTAELPLYLLSVGLLVHGHVSFLLFAGVTTVVVAVGWGRRYRAAWRVEVGRHRSALVTAAVLVGLFAMPLAVQTVRNFPGPWREYLAFSTGGERAPRTMGQVVEFVAGYWAELAPPLTVPVLGSAAACALVLMVADRVPGHRRRFGWLYAMVVLQTALVTFYVFRGVDILTPRETFGYVAAYYRAVPLVLVLTATAHALTWARARWTAPSVRTAVRAVTLGVAVLAVWAAAGHSTLGHTVPTGTDYHDVAAVLRDSPQRAGRRIELRHDELLAWPDLAGVAVELDRMVVPWCVEAPDPAYELIYTTRWVCPDGTDEDRWILRATTTPPPAAAAPEWTGSLTFGLRSIYPDPAS